MPRAEPSLIDFDPRLVAHRRAWEKKRALRILYRDYHRRLIAACPAGPRLEVGGGSGHAKDFTPELVSVDVLPFPGIDAVCDAHRLPFADGTFAGIIMLDVLHHLDRPIAFLREASRLLRPGGALAMIEPGMSPIAYPIYRCLHQEPADMRVDPFAEDSITARTNPGRRDPFDANSAIPSVIFRKENRRKLREAVPDLSVRSLEWLSLVAFPLSGGFKSWCLIPPQLTPFVIRLEDRMPAVVRRTLGFRLFGVLEKIG